MANQAICPVCNKQFMQGQRSQVYCGNSCANKVKVQLRAERRHREMIDGRKCHHCNRHFIPEKLMQTCCSARCKEKRHKKVTDYNAQFKRPDEVKPQPRIVTKPRQIETDADQARIKRAIDERHSIGRSPGRSLKGTPEWDDVVKTLTPPNRIKNTHALHGFKSAKNISFQGAYL